jgi:hypothetical protein
MEDKKDSKPIPWSETTLAFARQLLKEGITFSWADSRPDKTIQYTDEQVDALFRGEELPLHKED